MTNDTIPIDLPYDPRVQHCFVNLNGTKYHYLLAEPKGEVKATVFLIHGWPELSAAWRYQIPALVNIGCRVIAPDLMGFGGTEAPAKLRKYTLKSAADDIAELARQLNVEKIILGGHYWGGLIVYRVVLWYPRLVSHVFSVVTPYNPPSKIYLSTEELVNGPVPQFAYQLWLASGEVEEKIHTRDQIRQFLKGMFGATGLRGELPFSLYSGIQFHILPELGDPKLLTPKELEYYTNEYSRNGLHGTLNWYRTRKLNFDDELDLGHTKIEVPALFIESSRTSPDVKSFLSGDMDRHITRLTRRQVETGHWALVEAPSQVNSCLIEWICENLGIHDSA